VPYDTLNSFWREMISNGIIVKTGRKDGQDVFRLNKENNFVKNLITLFDNITIEAIVSYLS